MIASRTKMKSLKKTHRARENSNPRRRSNTVITAQNEWLKVDLIAEPPLIFHGNALHTNQKSGLCDFGPVGLSIPGNHRAQIRLGFVGNGVTIELAKRWIGTCSKPIAGPEESG